MRYCPLPGDEARPARPWRHLSPSVPPSRQRPAGQAPARATGAGRQHGRLAASMAKPCRGEGRRCGRSPVGRVMTSGGFHLGREARQRLVPDAAGRAARPRTAAAPLRVRPPPGKTLEVRQPSPPRGAAAGGRGPAGAEQQLDGFCLGTARPADARGQVHGGRIPGRCANVSGRSAAAGRNRAVWDVPTCSQKGAAGRRIRPCGNVEGSAAATGPFQPAGVTGWRCG